MELENEKDVVWTKSMISKLLNVLEQYPCLYDAKNNFYKNKHARRDSLFKITEYIKNELNIKLSTELVKKKIANIRTQLSRELQKESFVLHSGMDAEEAEVDHIWWYEQARFIIPHVNPRKGKGTIRSSQRNQLDADEDTQELQETQDVNDEVSDDDASAQSSSTPSTSSSLIPRRKVAKLQEDDVTKKSVDTLELLSKNTVETLELLNKNYLSKNAINDNSSVNVFGQFVATELNHIADQNLIEDAKHEICNILYNYKKKSLEVTTIVFEGPVTDGND